MDRDGINLGEGPCKSLSVVPLTQFVSGTCGIETGTYSIESGTDTTGTDNTETETDGTYGTGTGIDSTDICTDILVDEKTGARDSDAISWAESNRGGAAGYDQ